MRLFTLAMRCAEEDAAVPSQQVVEADYVEMKGIRLTGTPLYLDMQVPALCICVLTSNQYAF